MTKHVTVRCYEFDCLASHIEIIGRGQGASLRVACQRAIGDAVTDSVLRGCRPSAFKVAVVIQRGTARKG